MKCMITAQVFDESKTFPNPTGKDTTAESAQRAHAAEASKWQHVTVAVNGKEVLSGHLAPDVDPSTLSLVSK